MTNLSVHLAVSLGEPLPHQLADGTGAPPSATGPCGSRPFRKGPCGPSIASGISGRFQPLSRTEGQLALALLALPPLSKTNIATGLGPFDLHASSTLPAFVLSQNQTLRRIEIKTFRSGRGRRSVPVSGSFRIPTQTYFAVGRRLPRPVPRTGRVRAFARKSGSFFKDRGARPLPRAAPSIG